MAREFAVTRRVSYLTRFWANSSMISGVLHRYGRLSKVRVTRVTKIFIRGWNCWLYLKLTGCKKYAKLIRMTLGMIIISVKST